MLIEDSMMAEVLADKKEPHGILRQKSIASLNYDTDQKKIASNRLEGKNRVKFDLDDKN